MANDKKELIKAGPMAREMGVPVHWLKAEAKAGRIPHLKAGEVFLFEPETVKGILVKRAQGGQTND